MKNYFVFEQQENNLHLVGKSKDEFDSYIRNNVDDVMQWQANEIEESLNLGDVAENNPIVVECLDNGNEWVTCYPDSETIVYTQKSLELSEGLSVDFGDRVVYFKEQSMLNEIEKSLI